MISTNVLLERNHIPKTIVPPKKIESFALKEHLPTMYDLPSEDPEEPGLPDDFHYHQPQLLRETFRPLNYLPTEFYVASDLNLYYDPQHTQWYKRPDWFAVLGVPSSYGEQHDMRYSYVVWDERVVPFVVVELLSESTKDDDQGKTLYDITQPPPKWEVYEQILKIPYYVIFSRTSGEWQMFELQNKRYQQLDIKNERFWFPKIQLGLGCGQVHIIILTICGYVGITKMVGYQLGKTVLRKANKKSKKKNNELSQQNNELSQKHNEPIQQK